MRQNQIAVEDGLKEPRVGWSIKKTPQPPPPKKHPITRQDMTAHSDEVVSSLSIRPDSLCREKNTTKTLLRGLTVAENTSCSQILLYRKISIFSTHTNPHKQLSKTFSDSDFGRIRRSSSDRTTPHFSWFSVLGRRQKHATGLPAKASDRW